MAKKNFKTFMPIRANNQRVVLDENNGTSKVTAFTPATEDSLIYSISLYNSEGVTHYLNIYYNKSGVSEPFTQIEIPASVGTDGTNSPRKEAIDEMNSQNSGDGNQFLLIPAAWTLECNLVSLPSAGNKVVVLFSGQDFG